MGDYVRSIAITFLAMAAMIAVTRLADGWSADVLLIAILAVFLAVTWVRRQRTTIRGGH